MIVRFQGGPGAIRFRGWLEVCLGVFWLGSSTCLLAEAPQPPGAMLMMLPPSTVVSPDMTNPPVQASTTAPAAVGKPAAIPDSGAILQFFAETNGLPSTGMSGEEWLIHLTKQLEMARHLRISRNQHDAEILLINLMSDTSPEVIHQSALLELAALAQDANHPSRAQQIYAQFLSKWPNDLRVPEMLLQQGLLFRRMGLNNLAFTKFYGVMTSALVLKNDQLDYYVRLVLQAQIEIAETHYELGKYADAAEFFSRLLKQNNPAINKSQILYKLTRCHAALGPIRRNRRRRAGFSRPLPERAGTAGSPLPSGRRAEGARARQRIAPAGAAAAPGTARAPEDRPEVWAYWQQRAGNLIANQLYREGDYTKALEIYLNLAQLDTSPAWRLPVNYQIGMTYERLWQPQKATEIYNEILSQEKELDTDTPPNLESRFRHGPLAHQLHRMAKQG